jgi:hypothetical protein
MVNWNYFVTVTVHHKFTIIKPYIIHCKYAVLLTSMGYKTLINPFRLFKAYNYEMMTKDGKIYGDSFKHYK